MPVRSTIHFRNANFSTSASIRLAEIAVRWMVEFEPVEHEYPALITENILPDWVAVTGYTIPLIHDDGC